MEDVRELMEKYKLSEFIPEDSNQITADYKLQIEIELDGTYSCRYNSIDDPSDAYFMGEDIAEGHGYTLDECLHSLRNFIDDHTEVENPEIEPEIDYPFPEKVIDDLLKALSDITAAESPGDMDDIAKETLKKYGRKVAPNNY